MNIPAVSDANDFTGDVSVAVQHVHLGEADAIRLTHVSVNVQGTQQ